MPDPSVRRSVLGNGLRVVTEAMPGTPSATLGIWVENGSRYETRDQAGISHYLEHLFFKGTERRTAAEIAEEFDSIGGMFNAFTGKEATCYYAKVLSEHLPVAQDILADIFLNSTFDPSEIDRERNVILQEILEGEDTPDDHVHDLFHLNYWPGHPLSFPVCGNAETVGSFQQSDFLRFIAERYRPNRIVIAAAGNVDHERLVEWADKSFGGLAGTVERPAAPDPQAQSGVLATERPIEQVHICIGLPGIALTAPERYAAYLFNTALGGGMSSRLFQEVREKRGYAYSIYSFLSSYSDTGYLGIYAATTPDSAPEVIRLSLQETRRLAENGMSPQELVRTKNQLKGNMLLAYETSDSRMQRLARNEIFFGSDAPLSEVAAAIDATTSDDLAALAKRIVREDQIGATLLGNLGGQALGSDLLSPSVA